MKLCLIILCFIFLSSQKAIGCRCDYGRYSILCGDKCHLKKTVSKYENAVLFERISEVSEDTLKKLMSAKFRPINIWKGDSKDTVKLISNGNSSCQAFIRDTLIVFFNTDGRIGVSSMTVFGNKNISDEDFHGVMLTSCNTIPIYGEFHFDKKGFEKVVGNLNKIFKKSKQ